VPLYSALFETPLMR